MQTALCASEKILGLVTQTFDNQPAPTSFYLKAWASTMHHFAEQVRISKDTLAAIVLNTGAWEHKWTCWQPSKSSNSGERGHATGPDLPTGLALEVERLREQVRTWQGRSDSFRIEAETLRRTQGKGSKIPGGKGSNGYKDAGKRKDDRRDHGSDRDSRKQRDSRERDRR